MNVGAFSLLIFSPFWICWEGHMPAAGTAQISELTLTWINDQLRRELLKRMMEQPDPVADDMNWRRQMVTAVTALVSAVCLLIKNPFI
jgi:hypothetical protein